MTPLICPKWKPFLSYIFMLASLSCKNKINNSNEIIFTKKDVKEYAIMQAEVWHMGTSYNRSMRSTITEEEDPTVAVFELPEIN